MTKWSQAARDELERVYTSKTEAELLAHFPGKTIGQIRGMAITLQLTRDATGEAKRIGSDHPAAIEGRTVFQRQVRAPGAAYRMLVPGRDQRKIGPRVERRGAWHGWPIYSLTLEERATCPRTCHHWLTCMGNAMQWAVRIDHRSPEFLPELGFALEELQARHPNGFVVRLHILGDFFSVDYVERWAGWLDRLPALHVFGYTAHPPDTSIGRKVLWLAAERWDRFAVRLSSETPGPFRAITVFDPKPAAQPNVITCPAEAYHPDGTRQTKGCNTCGLCWRQPYRTIRFIAHGGRGSGRWAVAADEAAPSPFVEPPPAPRLVPELPVEAAIELHGSQRKAAVALGVSLGKLQRALRKGRGANARL